MVPKLVAPGASSDASSTGNEIPRPRLPPTCVPRAPLHPSLPSSSSAVPCRARPKLDPAAAAQHLRPTSPLAVPASSCWSRRAAPSADEELTRGLPCTSPPRIDLAPRSWSLGQEHLVVLNLAAVGDQH
ncbi:uncharacterized protein LOC123409819 [Hordeum vulgare subsp. vulgare]|uniref:uncharacterized protein LOC123409819 n=1 Tax=Hordeum vulgare subsp. vulgare TaxID=112509 RepID=UPI001D1A4298|nr:uncharacterized protein LOC123409819 [Hordeum vulgare subsp. vulgare]